MQELINEIKDFKNNEIGENIDSRIREFKKIDRKSNNVLFKELCFCILTANFNAEKSIKIQDEIGNGFLKPSQDVLSGKLKECGHRFPNTRADYICNSVKHKDSLIDIINSYKGEELRSWLVKNIKGFGYKEASHFLRNIGFENYAIIDFHIVDILVRYNLIKRPKVLTKRRYLEIERILKEMARKLNLNLAELDLYLWYIETKKILK